MFKKIFPIIISPECWFFGHDDDYWGSYEKHEFKVIQYQICNRCHRKKRYKK